VALTFDDGPGPSTPLILDILREAQAQATFFILGRHVAGFEAVLRRSAAEGHELGNHGFSHRSLRGHPWRALRELRATNRLIRAVTGTVPRLFRAPHGYVSPSVVAAAALAGLTTVQWDLDTRDYTDRAAGGIRLAVREKACGGSVILMHDAALNRGGVRGDRADLERRAATVAALPGVIDDLRARGYHLRPASAVLGAG
jgi:peptidoglycan/xylan/chitin deacetylase (PgdA/CDA1 family)